MLTHIIQKYKFYVALFGVLCLSYYYYEDSGTTKHENGTFGKLEWWQTTIIYQIYPRSFQDSNNDGIGDLQGITSRLEYFSYLNVKALWLSPIYASPMKDFGYDISDHTAIDPVFGTLEDFDNLLKAAHKLGIKIILDFVPNHTSDQHQWFIRSRTSKRSDNPYADFYIWDDGIIYDNGTRGPPNNWLSYFGNSAWAWDDTRQQYYLHQFVKEQPDLNWRNPKVQQKQKEVLQFWLDRGVDGFRVDAIKSMYEVEDLSQNEPPSNLPRTIPGQYESLEHNCTTNLPEIHLIIADWRKLLDEYELSDGDHRFLVAEIYDQDIREIVQYYHNGADMPFFFDLISINRDCGGYCIANKVNKLLLNVPAGKWPNFVVGNHDNKRIGTKLGSRFVNAINMLLLLLPGTPTTYYGEELGMTDITVSYEDTQDPFGRFFGPDRYSEVSRDPCRSPMQWSNEHFSGFTNSSKSWLPLHSDFSNVNVQKQQTSTDMSPLQIYKTLAHLREKPSFQQGETKFITVNENIISFVRKLTGLDVYLIIINFGKVESTDSYRKYVNSYSKGLVIVTTDGDRQERITGSTVALFDITMQPGEGLVLQLLE